MGGLRDPAGAEHLRVLRELRRAGLNPTGISITANTPGCAYCLALDHEAGQCPHASGAEQDRLFA